MTDLIGLIGAAVMLLISVLGTAMVWHLLTLGKSDKRKNDDKKAGVIIGQRSFDHWEVSKSDDRDCLNCRHWPLDRNEYPCSECIRCHIMKPHHER